MALKFDGVVPTEIKYNGTDLTALKYFAKATPEAEPSAIGVWGKPYALITNVDENSSLTVRRISSPNQNASTGVTLSNGATIYYGDRLQISAYASNGATLQSFTINGVEITGNNTHTVTSDFNIIVTSHKLEWHTIFTGSSSASNQKANTTVTYYLMPSIIIPAGTTRVRLTGSYYAQSSSSTSFTNLVISLSSSSTVYNYTFKTGCVLNIYYDGETELKATLTAGWFTTMRSAIALTKVEAYY